MPPMRPLLTACLALTPWIAGAQVTVKDDGRWRSLYTAGASIASGNSSATSVNLAGEAVRATTHDKWSLIGRALYTRNDDVESENRLAAGTRYQRDIGESTFGFGQFDALRDEPANLASRMSLGGGVGLHVIRREGLSFDISAGAGYSRDRYAEPQLVDGELRERWGSAELIFSEESSHDLTASTKFKQKLSVYPNLRESQHYRATFDSGITVAMTERLGLTATLSYRYDNEPAAGLKKGDALFVTGISYRID